MISNKSAGLESITSSKQIPELFGLSQNANMRKDFQEVQTMFDSILLTLPRQVSVFREIRRLVCNTHVYHICIKNSSKDQKGQSENGMILDQTNSILKKLPNNFDIDLVRVSHSSGPMPVKIEYLI
jgi:hypothetical protein